MARSALFMLALGLIIGFATGFIVGERQPLRPLAATAVAAPEGLPSGHPPIATEAKAPAPAEAVDRRAAEVLALLEQHPQDARLMVELGNLYFDASRWHDARIWYERARELVSDDTNVITDLAVVYRNLKQPEKALELLAEATRLEPDHWQAWYNRAVILHFDLHRHGEAAEAMAKLKELRRGNPQIPDDIAKLEADIEASL